jgi:hypothetical protein
MKLLSIFIALLVAGNAMAGISCGINVSSTVTAPKCANGSDGSIDLTISGGSVPQTSTKGLLISEFMADPTGNDSPNEFVELVATKSIDFSVTPYTIIFNNNNAATANGWVQGTTITYAFQISTGQVSAGDVIYVGGTGMIPTSNRYRAINYTSVTGDGGIGNVSPTSGVLGNGTTNADGIAVFNVAANLLTSGTVPIDAIFYGAGIGTAVVNNGLDGYQLPINEHYNGGKLQSNSFFINNNPISGLTHKASGVYDVVTNTFTTPRTWVNNATFTEGTSSVSLAQLYSFAWSNNETTQNVNSLGAGQYTVTITDAVSCEQIEIYNVIEPDEIALNITFFDASCFGLNDGGATTLLFGGTPGFTFEWSNGATTQNLFNVVAGDYDLTVTDANNCTAEATAFISGFDEIIIDLEASDASCTNASDGAVLINNITNGFPNFSYAWSNGATSADISQLVAGTYSLTVTDDFQCTATATAVVEELDDIDFEINTTDVTCFGGNNGNATVFNVTGGSGNYSFDYGTVTGEIGITDGTGNAAEIIAGEYTVAVYETNNPTCGLQKTFTINQPDALVVNATVTDASAAAATDGAISLNITGGTTPYTFLWSNGATTDELTGIAPGNYCLTVTDDNGCETDTCVEVDFAVGINNLHNGITTNATIVNHSLFANINYAEAATLSIEAYNVNGALIFTETKINAREIAIQQSTGNWGKGIYMVRFSANEKTVLRKILVQ